MRFEAPGQCICRQTREVKTALPNLYLVVRLLLALEAHLLDSV